VTVILRRVQQSEEEAMTQDLRLERLSGVAGAIFGLLSLALVGATNPAGAMGSWVEGGDIDNCDDDENVFQESAFVIATEPEAGDDVESGFEVEGCSRTFEGDVQWKLIDRDGSVLASAIPKAAVSMDRVTSPSPCPTASARSRSAISKCSRKMSRTGRAIHQAARCCLSY
jgi:hypothetical protein